MDDRNNNPRFTDDEACAAYDACYMMLRDLRCTVQDYREHGDDFDANGEPALPGGLVRTLAALEGALDKLGHDR